MGVVLGTSIADAFIGKFCVVRRDKHGPMFGTVASFEAYEGDEGERMARATMTDVRTMYAVRVYKAQGTNLSSVAVVGIDHEGAEVGRLHSTVKIEDLCEIMPATAIAIERLTSCPVTKKD
jgi:hypothetical protein